MNIIASKLKLIKPSPTLAISSKAIELQKKGYDIISLSVGESDFDTPEHIKKAAMKAIELGKTKYTAVDGMFELKQAICHKFKRENNVEYNIKQITVGSGAKQVIYNAFMASINPGDEVIIPAPYWVSYPDIVNLAEGKSVIVNCLAENNFKLTATELKNAINSKTKWLILNSPSNPTGTTYTEEELKALSEVLLDYPNIHIMSDDIYEHIVYNNFEFKTIAAIEPKLFNRILTVNGVSKGYAMTGWRIGYAAGPEKLIQAISIIQSQSTSNPCSISQYAALEALNGPQDFISTNKLRFQHRRDLLIQGLNKIPGIKCNIPEGAFYLFPSFYGLFGLKSSEGKVMNNSNDLAEYLLTEAEVAVVPGIAFGSEGFIRLSYALSEEKIIEACKRIGNAIAKLT